MYETSTVSQKDANQSAMWCHLSSLVFCWLPFGFLLAPIVMYFTKRDEGSYVRHHAKEAINFQLTMFLIVLALGTGFFMAVWDTLPSDVSFTEEVSFSELPQNIQNWFLGGLGFFALWALLVILAAMSGKNGKNFKYPIRIPFVR